MIDPVRPSIRLLSRQLEDRIIDEGFEVLAKVGVFVENDEALELLLDGGATREGKGRRVFISRGLVERALSLVPHAITLWDIPCKRSYLVGGDEVHFDPGSAALRIFDHALQAEREADTRDVVRFCRLTDRLENFHFQSTGLISSDVPEKASDCYRLFLGLRHCSKPVVTGTFVMEGFRPMAEMLAAVRGGADRLRSLPVAIFDACPSPPLKWSRLTAQSVVDCARAGIPSEFVSMPLTGATSPVTLTGALVQHTAESLSGVVIAQLAGPGAPLIYGGSPSSFDMRSGTPPMGAVETMMIDAAYAQIGKKLGLPTHAYMGLSDAKCVDAQAGLESGIGAILAALSGVNVVSGGGMMDFESCQSLEKLVIDNEICGMAYRLIEGIRQRDDHMAIDLLAEIIAGGDFLTHDHTLEWFRIEHRYPAIIDRGNHQQWIDAGRPELADRASARVAALLGNDERPIIEKRLSDELGKIMATHAKQFGMEHLPAAEHSPLPA